MATFAFKALDLAGAQTRGEIEADNKQTVSSQLRAKGLIVLDIEELKPTDVGDMLGRFKRVKATELTVATRQLATMISSGMSLLRSLYVLEEQAKSDKMREALVSVRKDVEAGIALSDALKRHPDIFNDLYIAMVGAGEVGRILVQKVSLARFSRTYSALIGAGVPMLQAIEITGKTAGNKVIEHAMERVRDSVKAGGSISTPMRAVPEAFPTMVTQMIGVGEETGALEQMLDKVADFYEDEVAASLKALTSILEPLMIIIVGGIVGFIVISMYMPMFKVYDQIR